MSELTTRLFYRGEDDVPIQISTGLDLTGYAASDLTFSVRTPAGSAITLSTNRTILDAGSGVVQVDIDWSELLENGEHFIQVRANGSGLADKRSPLASFFVDDQVADFLSQRWAFAPDSISDYTGGTAAEHALYGYFTDAAGLNPDGTSGAEWG